MGSKKYVHLIIVLHAGEDRTQEQFAFSSKPKAIRAFDRLVAAYPGGTEGLYHFCDYKTVDGVDEYKDDIEEFFYKKVELR